MNITSNKQLWALQYIFKPCEIDNTVDMILQVLLPALCKLSRGLFRDHLPGGKLNSLRDEIKHVKATSKTSCYAKFFFLDSWTIFFVQNQVQVPRSCGMYRCMID